MNQPTSGGRPARGDCLRLSAIDWRTYSRLLCVFAERPGVRLTSDRGELEIRARRPKHLGDDRFLARLVAALTEELGLPLMHGGSTTLRRSRWRGIEADECFWIANAARMTRRRRLDLRTDPPPDLAIEVDVTNSFLDRLSIYATLGVPEIRRLDGDTLTFHVLGPSGAYQAVAMSRSFPLVTPADLLGFLRQARLAGDENAVVRQFRDWIRQRRAASGDPPATP